MSDIKLDELLTEYKNIAHKLIDHEANVEGSRFYHTVNQLINTNADLHTVANGLPTKSSGLNLHHVSNNESEAEVVVNCFDCANAFKYDFDGTGCINCTNGSNHKTIN